MSMLTDRRLGATASYMRRRLGRSAVGEARVLDQRLRRVERTMTHRLRTFRGVQLFSGAGKPILVPVSPDGWIQLLSSDDSLGIERSPLVRRHSIDLTGGCGDCCPEDITWNTVNNGSGCLTIGVTFNSETCTYTLTYNLDTSCVCDDCPPAPIGPRQ